MRFFLIFCLGVSLFGSDFYYEFGKKVELTPVKSIRDMDCCDGIYRYKTKSGKEVKFKNEIITKIKDGVDVTKFFDSFGITNFSKLTKNTYLIKLDDNNKLFTLSQKLYESGKTVYATPNKINNYKMR